MQPFKPLIWDLWNRGGPFIGDDGAPNAYAVVEVGWQLRTAPGAASQKGPVRHWYDGTGPTQLEIPGLKSISWDRGFDADAASCTITLYNQRMDPNTVAGYNPTDLGDPGYYTWSRGDSQEGEARWGQLSNGWADILTPNALIRTYEGYGGRDKTWSAASVDGNVQQTGVWLVDEVRVSTNGMLELHCRDLAKLLIEQHLYPPLVPTAYYPIAYYRYFKPLIETFTEQAGGADAASTQAVGHPAAFANEGNPQTNWMSESNPHGAGGVEWIEFPVNGPIDAVVMRSWAGNFHLYVSVHDRSTGEWVGINSAPSYPNNPAGGPPFLADTGVPWESDFAIPLSQDNRYYSVDADRVRLTFTNLYGPTGDFRAGLREFTAVATSQSEGPQQDGNYKDYRDIILDLLLWAGFYDGSSGVTGRVELTGAFATDVIDQDRFDKQPVIDVINMIKEIVGYYFWIDPDGNARFEPPNWWESGNLYSTGQLHTDEIPEIDERLQLTDYTVSYSDANVRSEIIIGSEDPADDVAVGTTKTVKFFPSNALVLKGIVRPMMWLNAVFTNEDELKAMANLIAIHIWFSQRQGQVTIQGNPCIQIDDQVRIWERQTAEVFIHYVRAISSSIDLHSGSYTMTLTTHWLGDWPTPWAVDQMVGHDLESFLQRAANVGPVALLRYGLRGATGSTFVSP